MAEGAASVVVSILGDIRDLQEKLGKAAQSSEGLAGKIKGHSVAIGGAMTAAGGFFEHFGTKIEEAHIKLETVVKNAGGNFEEMSGQVDATVKHMEKFGHTSDDSQTALAKLTTRLNDPKKAMEDMSTVAEVAAFKHISLSEASDLVGKAAQGNAKVLKQFGIVTDDVKKITEKAAKASEADEKASNDLTKAKEKLSELHERLAGKTKLTVSEQQALKHAEEDVKAATEAATEAHAKNTATQTALHNATKNTTDGVTQLGDKLKGIAEGQADTFHGKMEALRAKVTDLAGAIGEKVGPAMVTLGPALAGLGPAISIVQGAAGALSGAFTALAANPVVLVILALVAVGVALYEAYQHVDAFRNIVDTVFSWIGGFVSGAIDVVSGAITGVWNWVSDNWPLLLGILGGPIGAAVAVIVTHWDTIKNAFTAVKEWIGERVSDIVGFVTSIPGRIGSAASTAFDAVKNAMTEAKNWVSGRFDDIVGFVTGMPGRIAGAAAGMWDGISDAFKGAVNLIIRGWNNLAFAIPGFDVGPVHWGGFRLDLPDIPPLAAGGIVSSPTVALIGEAGPEAVIPLDRFRGSSPVVNVYLNGFSVGTKDDLARALSEVLRDLYARTGTLGIA